MILKPEILAPAGSMEALVAALRCGADAVYLGTKSFSARANATNFDAEELVRACELAHRNGAKIYQTINTLVFDTQLESVIKEIKTSAQAGVDALIVQDLGIIEIIKQICPDMHIHASTQMTIHTPQGALLAKESGFSRVVVSRELSHDELSQITATGVEVEAFVHGALCMSVSGQCYMSAMIGSRSANRGQCAQACRLPFSSVCGEKRCDLSLKDLSLVSHIEELKQIGVASLKIEGRMKRPEYVAAAVTACRAAVDGKEPDMDTLRAVFSRSGFTDGYFENKLGRDMFGIRQKDDVVSADEVLGQLAEEYRKERKVTQADFEIHITKDSPSYLIMTDNDGNKVTVKGDVPQVAINRPTDYAQVEKQLSKLGDTIYSLGNINAQIENGLILPASALNNLRRKACEELDSVRININTKKYAFKEINLSFPKLMNIKHKAMRLELKTAQQLSGIDMSGIELVTMPLDEVLKLKDKNNLEKIVASLPRYTKDEKSLCVKLSTLKQLGVKKIQCNNFAHIRLGKEMGFEMHGGFGLNVTNSYSLMMLRNFGLTDACVSFELKLSQISTLADYLPYGVIAYGRLPLMLTVNCPIKQAVGCEKCEKRLIDRTGREFEVSCGGDAVEILNCDNLYMADRQSEINGVSFITLKFDHETPQQINDVLKAYSENRKPTTKSFTRGLYYRGII